MSSNVVKAAISSTRSRTGVIRSPKNSSLLICDMQEKFRKTIQYFPQIINTTNRIIDTARILNMVTLATEQYPKGLGPTVPELNLTDDVLRVPKTCFSMAVPEIIEKLDTNKEIQSVILCGIETQACILMTSLDLVDRGYEVHVVADAVSSRSMTERMFALERMRQSGVYVTTSESLILQLVRDAARPQFKEIQKLIGEVAMDTGLLTGVDENTS